MLTRRRDQGTVFGIYQHQGGSKADHTQMAFEVDDVRETKRQLEQDGVRFEEYDLPGLKTEQGVTTMPDGGQGAWFRDPGGNIIGLVMPTQQMRQKLRDMNLMGAGVR